jgi:hypothetical protein
MLVRKRIPDLCCPGWNVTAEQEAATRREGYVAGTASSGRMLAFPG